MNGNKSPRVAGYVAHVIDAAGRIQAYTAGLTREGFLADTLVPDGVIRNL